MATQRWIFGTVVISTVGREPDHLHDRDSVEQDVWSELSSSNRWFEFEMTKGCGKERESDQFPSVFPNDVCALKKIIKLDEDSSPPQNGQQFVWRKACRWNAFCELIPTVIPMERLRTWPIVADSVTLTTTYSLESEENERWALSFHSLEKVEQRRCAMNSRQMFIATCSHLVIWLSRSNRMR